MRVAFIFGVVILASACLYAGMRLTARLSRPWLWTALVVALTACIALLWSQVAAWPISNLIVMLVALLMASVIGTTLTSASAVIAFCITAGIVDFFSFSGGLTAMIISDYETGRSLFLQYLSVAVPLPDRLAPIIGVGDLIILGSVYYALHHLGHRDWLSFLIPLGGLLTALGIGLVTGGIYALPFVGVATIAYLLVKARVRSSPPTGSTGSGQ